MLKIIKKDGWYLENQVSSHRQFKHPSKPGRVTISGHRKSADVPL
jgi:predicted RNA binding protein YcfA (HicA-like mRNA interferase family)